VIEYGADPAIATELRETTASLYGIHKNSYAFKVCRIVPENNIVMILEAFAKTNHKLVMIGNWANSRFGIDVRDRFRKYENFSLLDPIYDQIALDELRSNCRLYVHGHSVGGTNPSLVEAMYLGLPCLVFDVNYNRETTEDAARYFASESDILSSLDELWSRNDYLDSMGKKLNDIAKRRYSWSDIVKKYRLVIDSAI
jgi:glycosyltransferase involved in cell wall biosynthesis